MPKFSYLVIFLSRVISSTIILLNLLYLKHIFSLEIFQNYVIHFSYAMFLSVVIRFGQQNILLKYEKNSSNSLYYRSIKISLFIASFFLILSLQFKIINPLIITLALSFAVLNIQTDKLKFVGRIEAIIYTKASPYLIFFVLTGFMNSKTDIMDLIFIQSAVFTAFCLIIHIMIIWLRSRYVNGSNISKIQVQKVNIESLKYALSDIFIKAIAPWGPVFFLQGVGNIEAAAAYAVCNRLAAITNGISQGFSTHAAREINTSRMKGATIKIIEQHRKKSFYFCLLILATTFIFSPLIFQVFLVEYSNFIFILFALTSAQCFSLYYGPFMRILLIYNLENVKIVLEALTVTGVILIYFMNRNHMDWLFITIISTIPICLNPVLANYMLKKLRGK